jgi:HAD superfamily hydrolase (TIGR01509 family)
MAAVRAAEGRGAPLYHRRVLASPPRSAPAVDWDGIDTVLLDMDGTLLDLSFDNWFWREHVPAAYAAAQGLSEEDAKTILAGRFRVAYGTLDWYCIDYWSRELALDVRALKLAVRGRVRYLPGADAFLAALKAKAKRVVLVTDSHPDTLAIKLTSVDLSGHFDELHSSHPFGRPKQDPAFWPRLAERIGLQPARALLVDDNLAVLRAARDYGIARLYAVSRPEGTGPTRDTAPFPALETVADLLC